MSLKKSDKIIAVIGVVILVIAAVGIILYTSTVDEEEPTKKDKKLYDFPVLVDEIKLPLTPDNPDFVVSEGGKLSNGSYLGKVVVSSAMLKNIEVFVEYEDNRYGLFGFGRIAKNMGVDTLIVHLLDENGEEICQGTINEPGVGNITLETSSMESPINFGSIKAEDLDQAKYLLDKNLTMIEDEQIVYQIHVEIEEKENLLRPLMCLLEKLTKDSFKLTVTENSYKYSIEDIEIPDDEEDEMGGRSLDDSIYSQQLNTMSFK